MNHDPLIPVLLMMMIFLGTAKLFSEIFERLKQPSVLGEIVAGIILGNLILINSNWNFFEPLRMAQITENWAMIIYAIAHLGVILLLFEIGLESTVAEMAKVGMSSLLVAIVGVIAPFILGFGVSYIFIKEIPPQIATYLPQNFDVNNIHIFIGATLCATSISISARVLRDLGKLHLKESKIILGAAVIDDVLGLMILAVVVGIVSASISGNEFDILTAVQISVTSIGFLIIAIFVGVKIIPRVMGVLAKLRTQGIMVISAVVFCFLLSWLAGLSGLASIVGAFAAGLILEEVHFIEFKERVSLRELIRPITTLFVPIFFVYTGIQVRLESFMDTSVLGLALSLTAVAIIGKQICGWATFQKGLNKMSIGIGMIPRGEVGLIFVGIGKSLHIIDDSIFSAIVIMVMITTLITPPLLKLSLSRRDSLKKNSGKNNYF